MNADLYLYCSDILVPAMLRCAAVNMRGIQTASYETGPDVNIPCLPMRTSGRGKNDYQKLMDAKATIANSVTLIGRQAVRKVVYDEQTSTLGVYLYREVLLFTPCRRFLCINGTQVALEKFGASLKDIIEAEAFAASLGASS